MSVLIIIVIVLGIFTGGFWLGYLIAKIEPDTFNYRRNLK